MTVTDENKLCQLPYITIIRDLYGLFLKCVADTFKYGFSASLAFCKNAEIVARDFVQNLKTLPYKTDIKDYEVKKTHHFRRIRTHTTILGDINEMYFDAVLSVDVVLVPNALPGEIFFTLLLSAEQMESIDITFYLCPRIAQIEKSKPTADLTFEVQFWKRIETRVRIAVFKKPDPNAIRFRMMFNPAISDWESSTPEFEEKDCIIFSGDNLRHICLYLAWVFESVLNRF